MNASTKKLTPEDKWHAGRQADAFFGLLDQYNALLAQNDALEKALDAQMKYQRELRADRDRLDWVLTPIGSAVVYGHIRDNLLLTRDNIDRAMGIKA
jgi:hypothetical protein